jgi:hypothetical protein
MNPKVVQCYWEEKVAVHCAKSGADRKWRVVVEFVDGTDSIGQPES